VGGGLNELRTQLGGSESFGTCDTNGTVFFYGTLELKRAGGRGEGKIYNEK